MRVIVCSNYDEMSKQAAKLVAGQVNLKPDCVLGLATGSTPIGLYNNLIQMSEAGDVDFSEVTTFNLDEYYPISKDNDQSYDYFMKKHLFSKVKMKKHYIPNGETTDPVKECAEYEEKIKAAGGIDLQILGIGQNGHIGFNEPDINLNTVTHLTKLTESTIKANSRFFENIEDVPTMALTMGIASILKSKKIILLASGRAKHSVVSELLNGEINTNNPASMLKVHPDVVLICDKEAYTSMYLGVDIGGTHIKFGVIDDDNHVLYKDSIRTRKRGKAQIIMSEIGAACKEIIKKYPIAGIGIGTPGIIDKKDGRVSATNLPFDNDPIVDYLKEYIDLPIYLDNDANCAALAECKAGVHDDDLLMVTLGTGIGGGIILDGKIYSGKRGDAGEIGHMCIQADGIRCSCGLVGCWEKYASVSALIEQINDAAQKNPDSIMAEIIKEENGVVDGETVFKAIEKGCPVAKKVFDKYLTYLATGINSVANIFRPETIVLAGGITAQGDALLSPLQKKLAPGINIKISKLQNDAGIIGAALLAKLA